MQITRSSPQYVTYGNRYGICLFRLPPMAPNPTSIFCRKVFSLVNVLHRILVHLVCSRRQLDLGHLYSGSWAAGGLLRPSSFVRAYVRSVQSVVSSCRPQRLGDLAWILGRIAAGWPSFGIIISYSYQFMEIIKGDSPLLTAAKCGPPLPCLVHRRSHHRIPARSPASQRRHVLCHGVVHGRPINICHRPSRPNLLGSSFRRQLVHVLGNARVSASVSISSYAS